MRKPDPRRRLLPPRPILVTGAHRSGSTWVGRMLAASPQAGYVWEPFSLLHRPGILDVSFPWWFPYVCPENEQPYIGPVKDMLAFRYRTGAELKAIRTPRDAGRMVRDRMAFARNRRRGARPLLKDPIAIFSAEWLADRFGAQVVVLIRHPAAFASSLKRLGWRHPFDHFLAQPLLMRDLLAPLEEEIRVYAASEQDVLDQAVLLWTLIHHVIAGYRDRHPEWSFVRHEDLSREPLAGFRDLYQAIGLRMDARIEGVIRNHSDAANPAEAKVSELRRDSGANVWNWKNRLTGQEVELIRSRVEPISKEFYGDVDWGGRWVGA